MIATMALLGYETALLAFLGLAVPTAQVTIDMAWSREVADITGNIQHDRIQAIWVDIQPGTCCIPDSVKISYLGYTYNSEMTITGLELDLFAAGWGARGSSHSDTVHCTGDPVKRFSGPGTAHYWVAGDDLGTSRLHLVTSSISTQLAG